MALWREFNTQVFGKGAVQLEVRDVGLRTEKVSSFLSSVASHFFVFIIDEN